MLNRKHLLGSLVGLSLLATPALSWKQAYPEPVGKYPAAGNLDTELNRYWAHWKATFNASGVIKATAPDNTPKFVSEAQSYGLLMAVWMNDEATFKQIYQATQTQFWNSSKGWYKWCPTQCGGGGENFAGDADIDIAGALIFASILIDKKIWTTDGSPSYKAQAKTILTNAKNYLVDGNGYIFSWPGKNDALNPSYHMPSWYPVFKDFAAKNGVTSTADWDLARSAAYKLFKAQTNSAKGMARSWSNPGGGASGCGDCQSSPNKDAMGFDGVRVPWRIGLDAIWYKNPDAYAWIKSTWDAGVVKADRPGMYSVDGPTLIGWCDNNPTPCTNDYERTLPRSMWGANAVAGRDVIPSARAAGEVIFLEFSGNNTYDHIGDYRGGEKPTDIDLNYFTQSLGMFGVLTMTGSAPNIWDDLNYPWIVTDTNTKVTTPLKASPDSVVLGKSVRLTATAGKAVTWKIYAKSRVAGAAGGSFLITTASKNLDSAWFTSRLSGLKAGDLVDIKAYWPGGTDTSRVVVRVVGSSSVQRRSLSQLPGILRLEGSLLRLNAPLGDEAIESVRFLDASGSVIATTSAVKTLEGLRLGQSPAVRGLSFFEILTASSRVQGRVFKL